MKGEDGFGVNARPPLPPAHHVPSATGRVPAATNDASARTPGKGAEFYLDSLAYELILRFPP